VSKARLLPWEQWVDDCNNMSVDESLEDLKGTHSRDMGRSLFRSLNVFSGLGIATISALLQIFGILSWLMQWRAEGG